MIAAYDGLLAEQRGEVGAEVVSAVALSPEQLEGVQQQLATAVGQTVKLSTTVDRNLLGGLVVRVGSRMLDASIRTKLQQLERVMKGAG